MHQNFDNACVFLVLFSLKYCCAFGWVLPTIQFLLKIYLTVRQNFVLAYIHWKDELPHEINCIGTFSHGVFNDGGSRTNLFWYQSVLCCCYRCCLALAVRGMWLVLAASTTYALVALEAHGPSVPRKELLLLPPSLLRPCLLPKAHFSASERLKTYRQFFSLSFHDDTVLAAPQLIVVVVVFFFLLFFSTSPARFSLFWDLRKMSAVLLLQLPNCELQGRARFS